MNKSLIIVVFLISLISCSDRNVKKESLEFENKYLTNIVLVDTFSNQLDGDNKSELSTSEFYPIYTGQVMDSIKIDYKSEKASFRTYNWGDYKKIDSSEIKIFVDTTKTIGSSIRYFIPLPLSPGAKKEDLDIIKQQRGIHKSYPVYIENLSQDTLRVAFGEDIPMIMQAKDSTGIWKPIQRRYKHFCGTGLAEHRLPPKNITITTCKLFKGTYTTKMRLCFGYENHIYSNEFFGVINYDQFGK